MRRHAYHFSESGRDDVFCSPTHTSSCLHFCQRVDVHTFTRISTQYSPRKVHKDGAIRDELHGCVRGHVFYCTAI